MKEQLKGTSGDIFICDAILFLHWLPKNACFTAIDNHVFEKLLLECKNERQKCFTMFYKKCCGSFKTA